MKKCAVAWIALAAAFAASAAALFTVFGPCPPPAMKCVTSAAISGACLAFGCLFGLLAWWSCAKSGNRLVCILAGCADFWCAVLAGVVPLVAGGCMKAEMRCRMYTFPYLHLAAVVLGLLTVCAMVRTMTADSGKRGA